MGTPRHFDRLNDDVESTLSRLRGGGEGNVRDIATIGWRDGSADAEGSLDFLVTFVRGPDAADERDVAVEDRESEWETEDVMEDEEALLSLAGRDEEPVGMVCEVSGVELRGKWYDDGGVGVSLMREYLKDPNSVTLEDR